MKAFMKKNIYFSLAFMAIIILFNGCSSIENFVRDTPFVHKLSKEDIKNIQYYISSGMVLEYKEVESESKVSGDNKVKKNEKVYKKDVVIFPNTPGIATDVIDDAIYIQFSDDITLGFIPEDELSDSPYTVFSINGIEIKDGYSIRFRGADYTVHFGSYENGIFAAGNTPKLQYKLSYNQKHKQDSETIKGKTL